MLSVQELCIALCTTKHSLDEIYREMLDLIGKQLKKLGLIAKNTNSVETLKVKKTNFFICSLRAV